MWETYQDSAFFVSVSQSVYQFSFFLVIEKEKLRETRCNSNGKATEGGIGMRDNENRGKDEDVRTKGIKMGHGNVAKRRCEDMGAHLLCVPLSLTP